MIDRPFAHFRKRAFAKMLGSGRFSLTSRVPNDCDVLWHPWNGIFLSGAGANVCTIADLAPFKFAAEDPLRRIHEQAPFIAAVAPANRILTFSHASKSDLVATLEVPADSITVTYLGVDDSLQSDGAASPSELAGREYFLFVGDPAEPRKNFALLYRAFRRAWPGDSGPCLAVLSQRDPELPRVVHLKSDTEDLEGKENTRLGALYRNALATVVPSLYEGFGMPVIESMACGTPVVAARASSLPEIAGEAALLEDPHDEHCWAQALERIAREAPLRAALRELGYVNVRRFRWKVCAQQTQAVFEEAAERNMS